MLDRLVLPDRPVEHDALLGVGRGLAQRRAAKPDALGADQDALGIHAVQDVFEALALLADPVGHRHRQRVDEQLVGVDGAPSHLRDFPDIDVAAVEVGVEQAQAFGAARDLIERRGAGKDEHLARDLRGRNPDLLTRNNVALAVACRLCFQLERVEPDVRLGDGEASLVPACHQRRQHPLLLLVAAEHHDRVQSEDVHVQRRSARQPRPRLGDGLHHQRGFRHAETRPAVFLGDADPEPAGIREGAMKIVREAAVAVLGEPVIVAKTRADFLDRGADRLLLRGQ